MPLGFPSITTTAGVGFLSFYPLHRRISVDLSNRSVTLPASGLDLHPTGDNWWGMEITTGVTKSALNDAVNNVTTASLTIRAFAGAADALYTVTTTNFGHYYRESANLIFNDTSFFSFVVTSHPPQVADLCRQALASGQASVALAGEIKVTAQSGRAFTSSPFVVTCHVPVIRPESF